MEPPRAAWSRMEPNGPPSRRAARGPAGRRRCGREASGRSLRTVRLWHPGSKAVLMGLAAHRSIELGRPVLWSEMLAEFDAARAQFGEQP